MRGYLCAIFAPLLMSSCYLSHQLGDGGEDASIDTKEWDDSRVQWEDSEVLETDSEVLETDSEVLRDGITGTQNGTWLNPIIERVDPEEGCTNKDIWMDVHGSRIHWNATITVTYPFSGRSIVFDEPNATDECNRGLVEWYDNSLIRFRTRNDLVWEDGDTGLVNGRYLVKVTNPNGSESNEVGFYLHFCSGDFEEIPEC